MSQVAAGPAARTHRKTTPAANWQEWIKEPPLPRRTATQPPSHQQIAELAYRHWLRRGCPIGSPEVDWFRAEQELGSPL